MYSDKPNIADYTKFLYTVAGIPQSALSAAIADPNTAPSLSETAGGTLPQTEYFSVYTYANASGETIPSPEASLVVDASNVLQMASPPSAPGAVSWNAYASLTSKTETLQASGIGFGTSWVMPVTGLVAGLPYPTVNTSEAPIIASSLAVALDIVNITLAQASSFIYTLAVYNLATDRLINYAIDLPGQNYFASLRKEWNLTAPIAGVATSGSDQSTSSAWLNPEQLKTLTLANLQQMRTPYGLQYLGFAQSYGQTLWGLT